MSAPLTRAAEVLKEHAEELRRAHKGASGDWFLASPSDRRAKKDHDEMLSLAAELEAIDLELGKVVSRHPVVP